MYKEKYLKYKLKYLNLLNELYGGMKDDLVLPPPSDLNRGVSIYQKLYDFLVPKCDFFDEIIKLTIAKLIAYNPTVNADKVCYINCDNKNEYNTYLKFVLKNPEEEKIIFKLSYHTNTKTIKGFTKSVHIQFYNPPNDNDTKLNYNFMQDFKFKNNLNVDLCNNTIKDYYRDFIPATLIDIIIEFIEKIQIILSDYINIESSYLYLINLNEDNFTQFDQKFLDILCKNSSYKILYHRVNKPMGYKDQVVEKIKTILDDKFDVQIDTSYLRQILDNYQVGIYNQIISVYVNEMVSNQNYNIDLIQKIIQLNLEFRDDRLQNKLDDILQNLLDSTRFSNDYFEILEYLTNFDDWYFGYLEEKITTFSLNLLNKLKNIPINHADSIINVLFNIIVSNFLLLRGNQDISFDIITIIRNKYLEIFGSIGDITEAIDNGISKHKEKNTSSIFIKIPDDLPDVKNLKKEYAQIQKIILIEIFKLSIIRDQVELYIRKIIDLYPDNKILLFENIESFSSLNSQKIFNLFNEHMYDNSYSDHQTEIIDIINSAKENGLILNYLTVNKIFTTYNSFIQKESRFKDIIAPISSFYKRMIREPKKYTNEFERILKETNGVLVGLINISDVFNNGQFDIINYLVYVNPNETNVLNKYSNLKKKLKDDIKNRIKSSLGNFVTNCLTELKNVSFSVEGFNFQRYIHIKMFKEMFKN